MRMTNEEYEAYLRERRKIVPEELNKIVNIPKSKYHNVRCETDGIKFQSKKELKRYLELKEFRAKGICWFLRQVPFHLVGNTKYIVDFVVYWIDQTITYEDVKGKKTDMYLLKKKQVEATYPIEIKEI